MPTASAGGSRSFVTLEEKATRDKDLIPAASKGHAKDAVMAQELLWEPQIDRRAMFIGADSGAKYIGEPWSRWISSKGIVTHHTVTGPPRIPTTLPSYFAPTQRSVALRPQPGLSLQKRPTPRTERTSTKLVNSTTRTYLTLLYSGRWTPCGQTRRGTPQTARL